MYEIIATLSNLTALTVIGFIYIAYIKNLRSVNQLKDSQLKVAEQNLKLWKDKALELERRSPEFVEKLLSDRIKIREDEISRLAKDSIVHSEQIDLKNREIESIKSSLDKAHQYRSSITVWDDDESDFVEVSNSDLEHQHIGSLCVDTASLMIGDPWYQRMSPPQEEDFKTQKYKYRVLETGEMFCTNSDDDTFDMELLGIDEEITVKELLSMGLIEKLNYDGKVPAIEQSYIKGDLQDVEYKKIRHLSFINGRLGAGLVVSLGGDGVYPVSIESYKGSMQRIIIDI